MKAVAPGKSLQSLVAEEAKRRVGQRWAGVCGEFVRDVLASCGINVNGRLRDFGDEVQPQQRRPGDVVLFYYLPQYYTFRIPTSTAILTKQNEFVGNIANEIVERSAEFCILNGLPYIRRSPIEPYESVMIRRIPKR